MKYAIVGSRGFGALPLVREWILNNVCPGDSIVSGGARGVDSYAAFIAAENDIPCHVIPANWDAYGKRAGFLRNGLIVDGSDSVIAFWDGKSRGTEHTIGLARRAGKPVTVIYDTDADSAGIV